MESKAALRINLNNKGALAQVFAAQPKVLDASTMSASEMARACMMAQIVGGEPSRVPNHRDTRSHVKPNSAQRRDMAEVSKGLFVIAAGALVLQDGALRGA